MGWDEDWERAAAELGLEVAQRTRSSQAPVRELRAKTVLTATASPSEIVSPPRVRRLVELAKKLEVDTDLGIRALPQ